MRTVVIPPLKKRESLCCWNNYIACIQMFKYIHSNAKQKNIRDIASSFNGGGHECACGIKNLTIEQVYEIIEQIAQRSK